MTHESPSTVSRAFKGIWIPSELWFDQRLTPDEKVFVAEIDSLDEPFRHCYASNAYFASFFQCKERKIQDMLSKLKKLGFVEEVSFDGRVRKLKSNLKTIYTKFSTPGAQDPKLYKRNLAPLPNGISHLSLIGELIEPDNIVYNIEESSLKRAKEEGSASPPPPPLESFYKEKFENKIQITPEQRERLVTKYGGMESLVDTYAEKLYRYSLVKPSNFKKYKRHDLVVEDWIDKDMGKPETVEKKRDDGLNDIQRRNWELNQALVQELKEDCPSKCGGLWFYYKAHLLKDKNNPDVDISGLADHRDFCMHLEKKLKISIIDKVFPRKGG